MTLGPAILWIVFAVIATWIYFLTQLDLPNYHPPTSTSIKIDVTTNHAKVLSSPTTGSNPSVYSKGIMNIKNVSELTFYSKDGTSFRKTKRNGRGLAYGGGGGIVVNGVSGTDGRNQAVL